MNRIVKILLIATVVVVGLGAAGIWWFLRDDAPAAVNLETAVESVEDTAAAETTASTSDAATSTAPATGVEGTWTVDTETGEFDYESATGTFAGFRIQEELASIGSATAVGRTGDVSGSITIEGDTLTAAEFTVDLTTITTNESRRDDRVQGALETSQFPTATFVLTEPVPLGATTGEAVSVTAVGELTIHGVTQPATFALEAQLVGDTIVVVGSTEIVFSDFGVQTPSAPVVVSVEDHGIVEMQLLLVRSA
jgi:polyisoprenoid-binding protein YceI